MSKPKNSFTIRYMGFKKAGREFAEVKVDPPIEVLPHEVVRVTSDWTDMANGGRLLNWKIEKITP